MNTRRKKYLGEIADHLDVFRAALEDHLVDEEADRDNIPEGLRDSPIYAREKKSCVDLQAAIDNLELAISSIEEAREA